MALYNISSTLITNYRKFRWHTTFVFMNFTNHAVFPMGQSVYKFPKNAPIKKTNDKISSQTEFTTSRRLAAHNKQDNKNMFLNNFDFRSNPCMHNSCLGISPKYLIFRNAPKPIIDLCGISFLCANFETFTTFCAVVL